MSGGDATEVLAAARARPARSPHFTLRDATGRLVASSRFSGDGGVVLWVHADCQDVAPLAPGMARALARALLDLADGAEGRLP